MKKTKYIYVDNTSRKPENAGIYCVINIHGDPQTSYFNGNEWDINSDHPEYPEFPVLRWLDVSNVALEIITMPNSD